MNNYILFEYNNKMYKYDINYFAFCKNKNPYYIRISLTTGTNLEFFNKLGFKFSSYLQLKMMFLSYDKKKFKFNSVVISSPFVFYNQIIYSSYIPIDNFDDYILECL